MIGTGRVCIETLRPLAYTLLAELVHYVREDISLPQVKLASYIKFICVANRLRVMFCFLNLYVCTVITIIFLHDIFVLHDIQFITS